ncbi:MAG: hypothetical protein R2780_11915 [Crocinitomicaceae bacterium]|nr:hypothetical protein [Crocinitomicaceae bacterium]
MTKRAELDLKVKACRPILKHEGNILALKDKITIEVDQILKAEDDKECLDVDLEWETEAILADDDLDATGM